MVRTFVCRKGEEQSREIDLDEYVGVVAAEMRGGRLVVKGINFERKEDEQ